MASSKKFWIFSDGYCFFGFFSQILYNLVPIAFLYQLKNGVLKRERLSIVGILCLYGNAFIYFWLSLFHKKEDSDIDPLDFCNLAGGYLGLIYVIIYIYYLYFKKNKKFGLILWFMVIVVSGSVFLWIMSTVDEDDDNKWVDVFDWIGVIFNVLENLPLGFSMAFLIKNKISDKFTLFGATIGLINVIIWLAWAINAKFNNGNELTHSIVANILAICLHFTQFFIFFKFRKEDSEEDAEDNSNSLKQSDEIKKNNENIMTNTQANSKTQEKDKEPDYIQDLL